MTVTASLAVSPVDDPDVDFDAEVAAAINALENCDVCYETHPMETTLEAESLEAVFSAAQTATEAVDAQRVSTTLKIDHYRNDSLSVEEKVDRVEEHLDGEARSQ